MSDRMVAFRAGVLLAALAPALAGCSLLFGAPPIDVGPVAVPSPAAATEPPGALPTASSPETQPPVAASQGALPSSAELATLLGPDDFAAVGVRGRSASFSDAGPGSVYAVYAGLSSAAGGIELDVFVLPTAEEAASLVQDPGFGARRHDQAGTRGRARHARTGNADQRRVLNVRPHLGPERACRVDLGIPSSPESRDQLVALAALVLERSQPYR